MVQPLLDSPPVDLTPVHSRVKVAPTITEAFNSKKFDVIFTVSVLIHNSPENSAALCQVMASMLSEGGELWLIENALVSLSMRENNWHGGCWVHDFAGARTTARTC
jgi:hypothetical protein